MADVDRLSPLASTLLKALQESGLAPINVTSGYRDPDYNRRVGGAKNSRHTHGDALDISTSGWDDAQRRKVLEFALANGARGVGIYPNGSIHLDVRDGSVTAWGPNHSYSSQPDHAFPEWARDIIASARGGAVPAAPRVGPTLEAAKTGVLAPAPVPLMPGQAVQAPQAPSFNPLLTALAGAQGNSPVQSGGPMGAMVRGIAETARAAAAATPAQQSAPGPTAGDFGLKPTESASAASNPEVSPVAPAQSLGTALGDIVASIGRVQPVRPQPQFIR